MFAVSNASNVIIVGLNLEFGNTRQLWFWQKRKKKKSSDVSPDILRPRSPENPTAIRTHNIQGWFLALCLPPGIEKSQSRAAGHFKAGPLA